MAFINISVEGPPVGPQLASESEQIKVRVAKATGDAAQKLVDNILKKGRADISGAGKFGPRWTQGLTAEISGDGQSRTITVRHAVSYWTTHQFGAVIHGKPLLWIPMKEGGPRARDFGGRLFRVDRKGGGAPLLLSVDTKTVEYHGHESVRVPKRFHLIEIAQAEAKTLGALFKVEMASGG